MVTHLDNTFGHLLVLIVVQLLVTLAHAWGQVQRFHGAIPPFINNEYFCEYGSSTTEPLWDGGDCPSTSTCCTFNNPPWFCKQLCQDTTDDIEVRVCANQSTGDEDLQIEVIELYAQ